jgi:hypothetical protein
MSAAGLAIIIGRIICGWCLDRFHGPYVAACFFLLPMVGIALLSSGWDMPWPVLGAALCGAGIGAEVDLMAFFISRYFGLKAYGTIYGVTFTPTDMVSYNTFTTTVSVAVNKITSTISVAPSASAITEGQALSASVLSGGTGSVAGAFAWTTPSTVPTVGTASYGVTFTPTDTANYSTAVTTVSLTVNPAGTTYSGWLGQAGTSDAAFLDYVFGATAPGALDPSLKPTVAVTDGKLVLTYYVRQGTVGLTVTPKASANLALGSAGWSTVGVDDTADVSPITVNGVTVQRHAASVPVSGLSKFLRIEAVQQ